MLPIAALLFTLSAAADPSDAPLPPPRPLLEGLRPGHPRLIVLDRDMARVRQTIASDPLAKKWLAELQGRAEQLLTTPPVELKDPGPTVALQAKARVDRIYTLATVYRLGGDRRFAERARREALAAAALPDWRPGFFLDTAEMAHAVAIAYDWLYDVLGPDRAVLRAALYEKALKPALESYVTEKGWSRLPHNWNQVCNGGIVLAALAVADEEPKLAEFVVAHALESVRLAMANYAPDGGWNEAAHFWHYATRYTVYMIAGLESALGTDFGLAELPGFSRTGDFPLYVHGPTGRPFNYADTNEGAEMMHELFWLGRRFDRPVWAWQRRNQPPGPPHALDLLWFDPRGPDPRAAAQPLDAVFHGGGLAAFRSAWQDPNAVYAGLRTGSNGSSHNNLDLGDFVLEAKGKRWAVELGRDDMSLPGYFGPERPRYYRIRTEGQNTLTIDGDNQPRGAVAPIVAFRSQPQRAFAITDLTAAYPRARSVRRGLALLDRERVVVQDEIEAERPIDVSWAMHTPARIQLGGRVATLTLDGATLRAQILSPKGARFELLTPSVPPPQKPIAGIGKLVVRLAKVRSARLVVLLDPVAGTRPAPPVEPLARWADDGRPEHALRYRGEQPDPGLGSPAFPRDALVAARRGR